MPTSSRPTDDLARLIAQSHESRDVDYKAPSLWDEGDKASCCSLVKDILAMANHDRGGFLVVGVGEDGSGNFVPVGLTPQQAESFESSRLGRFVARYAVPTINLTVHRVRYGGLDFVVVSVPAFGDVPHICTRDYPGVLSAPTIYVRTDSNESAPVSRLSDMQALVERAMRNRADSILSAVRAVLTGSLAVGGPSDSDRFAEQIAAAESRYRQVRPYPETQYNGYRQAILHPVAFSAGRYGLDALRSAASSAEVNLTGFPFLFTTDRPDVMYAIEDGVECNAHQEWAGRDTSDYWSLRTTGLLFHSALMWEEALERRREGPRTADFVHTTQYVAESLNCLVLLYSALGIRDDEEIVAVVRLVGTEGRELRTYDPSRGLSAGYVSRTPTIEVRATTAFADWRAGLRDHAVRLSKEVIARFNWYDAEPVVLRQIVDALLDRRPLR